MAEDAGAARGRHLRLHAEEPEAAESPAWWSLEAALDAAPAEARPLVERLASRLFLSDDEAAAVGGLEAEDGAAEEESPSTVDGGAADPPPAPDGVDLETAWSAVEALRAAIVVAAAEGAPSRETRALHRRLDREARALALRALARALADSRRLLRDVSHDLRSPLNSVLFLADTLMSEHAGSLNEVQRRQVGVLYTAAVTLVGLVNDLIDASRIGEGVSFAVSKASFTVDSVLSDVKGLLGPLAAHRGAELRFHVEIVGARSGDRQLLSRVLINLVSNAVQAAAAGGHVEVRVRERRDGLLRVEVRDDGDGEDPERLRRLLSEEVDPYRAGRTRGWTHGLGLTISSRLVRAAGGSISVDSEPGAGTTFTVELPFPAVD